MPISGPVLGSALALAAASTDAAGMASWKAIGGALAAWLPTGIVSPLGAPPLVAAGPVITGSGAIAWVGGTLGAPIAAAAGSRDAVGIAAWARIAAALGAWLSANAKIQPLTLVGFVGPNPTPGPVTGAGKIMFVASALGTTLAAAAGAVDLVGIAKWNAIGTAILQHLATAAVITPLVLVNPGTGGPVTGTALLT